jgi:hypothetical protein
MRDDGYYVEEVAAVLKVGLDEARQLSFGMDDGDIDLGLCIHRHKQKITQELIDNE